MTGNFTSFFALFQSYQDNGKATVNGSKQWNPVYDRRKDFHLQQVSDPEPPDQQASALTHWATKATVHNTLKCLSVGTPKTINFPFVPIGNLMVLDVPIYKHFINRLFWDT